MKVMDNALTNQSYRINIQSYIQQIKNYYKQRNVFKLPEMDFVDDINKVFHSIKRNIRMKEGLELNRGCLKFIS